jgi:hypothetical protein
MYQQSHQMVVTGSVTAALIAAMAN